MGARSDHPVERGEGRGRPRVVIDGQRIADTMIRLRVGLAGACTHLGFDWTVVFRRIKAEPQGKLARQINHARATIQAWYENRLAVIAERGERRRGELGAIMFWLGRQGRAIDPTWGQDLPALPAIPGKRHVIHVDMSELRARAAANDEANKLIREVETSGNGGNGHRE